MSWCGSSLLRKSFRRSRLHGGKSTLYEIRWIAQARRSSNISISSTGPDNFESSTIKHQPQSQEHSFFTFHSLSLHSTLQAFGPSICVHPRSSAATFPKVSRDYNVYFEHEAGVPWIPEAAVVGDYNGLNWGPFTLATSVGAPQSNIGGVIPSTQPESAVFAGITQAFAGNSLLASRANGPILASTVSILAAP